MIYITDTKFDTDAGGLTDFGHAISEVRVFGRGMFEIRLIFPEINIRFRIKEGGGVLTPKKTKRNRKNQANLPI